MKHKVIIKLSPQGYIDEIHASGDTDIVLENKFGVSKLELDSIFRVGDGHKFFKGKISDKVKEWNI
jgi:hypothetical protein